MSRAKSKLHCPVFSSQLRDKRPLQARVNANWAQETRYARCLVISGHNLLPREGAVLIGRAGVKLFIGGWERRERS